MLSIEVGHQIELPVAEPRTVGFWRALLNADAVLDGIVFPHGAFAIKKNAMVKSQLPMRIVSFVPTLIGAIIAILPNANPNARIIAISVGGAITGLVNILMTGKNANTNEQMTEQITELQIKYQPHYCCPKCGMKFPFTTHWKKLEADGICPNPKCNASFVKHK